MEYYDRQIPGLPNLPFPIPGWPGTSTGWPNTNTGMPGTGGSPTGGTPHLHRIRLICINIFYKTRQKAKRF